MYRYSFIVSFIRKKSAVAIVVCICIAILASYIASYTHHCDVAKYLKLFTFYIHFYKL